MKEGPWPALCLEEGVPSVIPTDAFWVLMLFGSRKLIRGVGALSTQEFHLESGAPGPPEACGSRLQRRPRGVQAKNSHVWALCLLLRSQVDRMRPIFLPEFCALIILLGPDVDPYNLGEL